MYKLGVMGKGISYSLSPKIHKEFAKQFDIKIDYQIYDIEDDPLNFVEDFFAKGGLGLNVTKPYKEIFTQNLVTEPESINCIYDNGTKRTSTDGVGFINDLQSKKIDYTNMNIMVYGLGGASKSILNSIKTSGNLFLANRTEAKIEEAIKKSPNFKNYNGESLDLVISCAQNLDLNTTKYFEHLNLSQNTLLYDINYSNQTNKVFSNLSIVSKNNLYNGIGMLVEQASECFKLWFNKKPEVEEIKSKLNERL